jgi:hypothetical protein
MSMDFEGDWKVIRSYSGKISMQYFDKSDTCLGPGIWYRELCVPVLSVAMALLHSSSLDVSNLTR